MIAKALRKISKHQLKNMEWRGAPRSEVEKLKANDLPYVAPYLYLPNIESDIRDREIKKFHRLLEHERNGKIPNPERSDRLMNYLKTQARLSGYEEERLVKRQWEDESRYREYVDRVLSDLSRCGDCHVQCCSVCRDCKVIHFKAECGETMYKEIREKFKTWRSRFEATQKHEGAIMNAYYRWIAPKIRGSHCPCERVSESYDWHKKKMDYDRAIFFLKGFHKETLERHLEMIEETKT
jgi:hypothetical protein